MALTSLARWLCGVLVLAGLALGAARVFQLERGELDFEGEWHTLAQLAKAPSSTRVSAQLARVPLGPGQWVLFELCARDGLDVRRWRDAFELAIIRVPQMELMLRVPLDRTHLAQARRNPSGACMPLGSGRVDHAGDYSLSAVWPARAPPADVQQIPLRVRVLARTPLSWPDWASLLPIAFGLVVLLATWRSVIHAGPDDGIPRESVRESSFGHLMPALVAGAGLLAVWTTMQWQAGGASLTLVKGMVLAALQVTIALAIARMQRSRSTSAALAVRTPPQPAIWSAAAVTAALFLALSARIQIAVVPSTGQAPIQSFIDWPSGMLCFALLGLILPIGEELLFRGALYRVALPLGPGYAFWITSGVFIALHAQQSWGNWGGLLAIAEAGLAFTGLRLLSHSVLVPMLAHVLYNVALSIASF